MSPFRLATLLLLTALSACVPQQKAKNYGAFREADPRSILVVPAINRSVYVNAPDYYLSTIARPLAERGYYVFPVNLVKHMLDDDGLSDANLVHDSDTKRLAELFGADAVLYVTIERWDSQYILLSTTTTVEISYSMKAAGTGQEIWHEKQTLAYSPQASGGNPLANLIATAIVAAIEKADPNYLPLAKQANALAVGHVHTGLPAGPYIELYKHDQANF